MSKLEPFTNPAYRVRNVVGKDTLYMNWGLWDGQTQELDNAALALILRMGKLAGLGINTNQLDVGFGYGDQLLDWAEKSQAGRIEGINICPEQTEVARTRLAKAGLSDRVHVQVGNAVSLPFEANSFDVVTAVECAFHFNTRERFFSEARRVLKKGGRLVLADFIGIERPNRRQRLAQWVASNHWGFAEGSFCLQHEYQGILKRVGFDSIKIERVTDQVLKPGLKYARRRLFASDFVRRVGAGTWITMMGALNLSLLLGDPIPGEYVLVSAVR